MIYIIVSPRLGTPGDEFKVKAGVNIEALLAHGFIKQSTPTEPKPSKVRKRTKE